MTRGGGGVGRVRLYVSQTCGQGINVSSENTYFKEPLFDFLVSVFQLVLQSKHALCLDRITDE